MGMLLYLFGTFALLLCDLLVTRHLPAEQIALWAEARSLIGILGVLAAAGLDLVMVRSPQSSGRLLRLGLVQVPLLAVPVALAAHGLGYFTSPASAAVLVAGSAWGLILAQYFRAHHHFMASQLVQQGWKIGALVALGLVLYPVALPSLDWILGLLLLVTAAMGGLSLLRLPPSRLYSQNPDPVGSLYAIGMRFMVTSLILALAVYGEQLLVNGLGSVHAAAVYFMHATYFLFPISVLNGYLAFRIGPWLRHNHDFGLHLLRRHALAMMLGVLIYAGGMHAIGVVTWMVVVPAAGAPDPVLQAVLLVSALARTVYTIPSAYNGIFGRPRQHDVLIAAQIALLLILGVVVFAFRDAGAVIYLIAIVGALNWVLRTGIGFAVMRLIANDKGNPLA